jgi:hypothetical protein
MANVHVTQESRSLRCDLTNLERLEKGRQLAEADAECARIDEEKSRVASQYAASLKTATSRRHELAGAIRQGYEFRDVLCRVQFVYPDREVVVAREDTGEVIERRGMNPTELRQAERRAQGDLFPEEEKPQTEPVMLADTDPDVQAAKAAENTDATAPGAGEADAPADAQTMGEAAAEPTPAGEAASPAESEQQRKPRSDKGKARGPRKAHEPDARDPGFEAHPAATEAAPAEAEAELPPAKTLAPTAGELLLILPIMDPGFSRVLVIATDEELEAVANSEKARRIPHLAVAVKRELRRRANAEPRETQPESEPSATEEPKDCADCGHLRIYHEEDQGGCIQPDCGCMKLFGKAGAPEETEEATPAPAAHSRACSVCGCAGYAGSSLPNGTCRKCGHREDYHLGRGGAVDPLGLGATSKPAASLDAMKGRLAGEGEARDATA